ncbi:MAG: holo-[acyl-carrier-protein] synthase [Pseudomonadota bacterium]|jgi:holo-[acyl-carrier protein] synthase
MKSHTSTHFRGLATSTVRIGTDLVSCERIRKSVSNETFLAKVFHPNEIDACRKKPHSEQSFAGRFAAKEAFLKALGTGLYTQGMGPQDVWVESDTNGRPLLCLSEAAQTILQKHGNCIGLDLSISHDSNFAIATVVIQFNLN